MCLAIYFPKLSKLRSGLPGIIRHFLLLLGLSLGALSPGRALSPVPHNEDSPTNFTPLSYGSVESEPRSIEYHITLPAGMKFNPLGKSLIQLLVPGLSHQQTHLTDLTTKTTLLFPKGSTIVDITAEATIFYCEKAAGGICYVKTTKIHKTLGGPQPWVIGVEVAG